MKKFLTLIIALVSASLALTTAYAEDYSEQLIELKTLVAECNSKGLAVPYEKLGLTVFERFIGYLEEDEKNGVSQDIMTYNHNAMSDMYSRTKTSLEAYLAGTKSPVFIPEYDMMNTSISGKGITDGENNIISTGYGVFDTVEKDIENLHSFGMMNMQMETGPKHVTGLPDWSYGGSESLEYAFDVVNDGTDRALKITVKSEAEDGKYRNFINKISVLPSTTYYYKLSYKGKNVDENAVSVRINNGKLSEYNIKTVTDGWTETRWNSFTTGANDTSVTIGVYVVDKCEELLIDDVIIAKQVNGENLLENGDFENLYSVSEISAIQKKLERAKRSNVSVSFLLQPLYLWRVPGCEDMYASATSSLYNVNDERAKAKVEEYLRVIVPIIAKSDAVRDICITNEPDFDTRTYPDFYNPKFRDYLIGLYGNLSTINSKYKTSYGSIEDITMPTQFAKSAIFYDWICFNEDMVTEWNSWIASIVKEYTNKPVHSKVMNYIVPSETDSRKELLYGVDMEKFATFCDYAGNDASNSLKHEPTMVTKMMWYDYLNSVIEKPIYNSEDHFISDGDQNYSVAQKNNTRYNLWQGAVHGRAMSTMWVWERTYDASSALHSSILTRPDCVEEAGYTSLDLVRNAEDVLKLASKTPEVALFYSKTSRVFNDDYMDALRHYYTALMYNGKRVGFVTETSLDKLSRYKYLVIPYVTHTTPEALAAVNSFIDNGGKVIFYGEKINFFGSDYDCMAKDKFGNSLDNSKIESKGTRFSKDDTSNVTSLFRNQFSDERVHIVDSNNRATTNVEYEYVIDGDNLLVNMVYMDAGTKTVSVTLDGNKLSGMKNIITGEKMGETYTLTQYVPLTLKLKYSEKTPSAVKNLTYKDGMLSWDDDENAVLYNLYYTIDNGLEMLYNVTEDNYCVALNYGEYRVVPENSVGETGAAATVTVEAPIGIAFESVNIADAGVTALVKVSNKTNVLQKAVIKVKTAEGKLAINDVWLQPMGDWNFRASFDGTTELVTASVSFDVNGDAISSVNYGKQ